MPCEASPEGSGNNIPEDILFECGFITNYNTLRLNRKRNNKLNKINAIQEYGLDGVAVEIIDNKKVYHALQMKLWDNTLRGHDLGTFWQVLLCRMFVKNVNSKGYLYHSCKLENNVKDDIENHDRLISDKITNFYENIKLEKTQNKKILRDYQTEAITNLNKKWKGIKSLILPCGTGKTFIVCKYLEDKSYKNIFIFSPLRMHAKQFLNQIKEHLPKYNSLLADCDGNLDINDIKKILNKKSIISTTFKSAKETLSELFNDKLNIENSILIIDEAHNLINDDELNNIIKKFNKVVLVTATPPTQLNEKFESKNIFKYSMHDAIKNKYICDYNIYLPLIVNEKVSIDKPNELSKLDDDLCKKGLFIINGMLKTGSKKCIVYLSSIEECILFNKIIKEIMEKYHFLPCWTGEISSNIGSKQRQETLNNFQKYEKRLDTLKFLASVRILDEGIDIIKCDSVFITKIGEYTSDIKTVQRLCRGNRLDKDNKNKITSCFLWCDDLNKSIGALQLLKENDIDFIKKIHIINSNYDTQTEDKNIIEAKNKNLVEFINVKCLNYDEIWKMKYNILVEYINLNKRIPRTSEKYKNINIRAWLGAQKNKIKSNEDSIYINMSKHSLIKECLDEYLKKEKNLIFDEGLKIFLEYINLNKRIPRTSEKYKNINIGNWLNSQKMKIKSNKDDIYIKMSKNAIVKKCLDEYLNREKKDKIYTFDETLDIFLEYVNENKKIPTQNEKYKNTNIGVWLNSQKMKIKSNEDDIYIKDVKKCNNKKMFR
jgi:superfamily II DNA or RNA helicase